MTLLLRNVSIFSVVSPPYKLYMGLDKHESK